MDPVFSLYSMFNRFLNRELSLEQFEREFVPLVPHFAERPRGDAAARLVLAVDEMLVDIGIGQMTEAELLGLLAANTAGAPTVEVAIGEPPRVEATTAEATRAHLSTTGVALTTV